MDRVIRPSYLGQLGGFVGIDTIRLGQVENGNPDELPVDLSEVASLIVWLTHLCRAGR